MLTSKVKMKYMTIIMSFISSTGAFSTRCPRTNYPPKFQSPFQSIAVFGDSFSDVGNIHILSNGTQPGVWSFNGRYSDGRVWVEYIQQFFDNLPELRPSLGGGTNYAYGGATVENEYIHAYSTALDADVPCVSDQISQYLQHETGDLNDDRLHVLFAGYNDYWWYAYRNYTTSDGQDFNLTNVYTNVANNVVDQVQRLYTKGARQFLVGNAPNMSSWAEAALQTQEVLDSYDVLVDGHNRLLSSLLTELEELNTDATIYTFDAFDTFDCLNQYKDFFGIQNIHEPCHPTEGEDCGDIFSYKFWDYYHPTTHAHHIAAMSALQSIYHKDTKKPMRSKSGKAPPVKTSLRS